MFVKIELISTHWNDYQRKINFEKLILKHLKINWGSQGICDILKG